MNNNTKIMYKIYSVGMFFCSSFAYAMHMPTLSDILVRPSFQDTHFQLCACLQGGIHAKAYAESGAANALAIWQPQQNALAMLNNFDPLSPMGMKRIQLDAIDDGVRGHFIPSGTVSEKWAMTYAANLRFYQDWTLRLYVPLYATELSNVCWLDQTLFDNEQDLRVRQYLTNDFLNQVKMLGDCLDLCSWKRVGIGDTALFFEWDHNFIQTKPFLKNVHLDIRSALHIPTGKNEDVDKIAAFAFGYDGAWGVSCALGIDLSLSKYLRAGLDVQLTHIFGRTKMRRIKTDVAQTDLLLLQKALVYKDSGLEQQFSMYVEAHSYYNVTARVAYQFFKHGEDTYALVGNAFSNTIINTAERLQDFTVHHIITTLTYKYDRYEHIVPSVELFALIPVKGKRSIASTVIGGTLSFDF